LKSKLVIKVTLKNIIIPSADSLFFFLVEDDDSGDDDDYLSRNAIKRTSQQIVDAKTKKNKPRPKKKNKK